MRKSAFNKRKRRCSIPVAVAEPIERSCDALRTGPLGAAHPHTPDLSAPSPDPVPSTQRSALVPMPMPGSETPWPGCVSSTLSSGGRANPVMIRAASSCEGLPWTQGCTHTGMRATTRWPVQRRIASSLRGARSETDDLARGARLLACHCCRSRHRLRQGGSDLSGSGLGAGCGKVSERSLNAEEVNCFRDLPTGAILRA